MKKTAAKFRAPDVEQDRKQIIKNSKQDLEEMIIEPWMSVRHGDRRPRAAVFSEEGL